MRKETYKNTSYTNAIPSWNKKGFWKRKGIDLKDPLEGWKKVKGFVDSEKEANQVANGLKKSGVKIRTKIIQTGSYFDIYYKGNIGGKR